MNWNQIIQGDTVQVLKSLPDESMDCVMTSPPYWGLRDYGVEGQLGLEPIFEEYVRKLCDIFDEVKRVLKKEGTCWINLRDSYIVSWGNYGPSSFGGQRSKSTERWTRGAYENHKDWRPPTSNKQSVKEKSLCMIPSRFAIEMCNRGWILRNEIIWHKPNCMPSSAKDRFTIDFEKLLFFTKSKKYWFETQYEKLADPARTNFTACGRTLKGKNNDRNDNDLGKRSKSFYFSKGRIKRTVWKISTKPFPEAHFAVYPEELCETPIKAGCPVNGVVLDPFCGSGTTCIVAKRLGRQYVGIELNSEYIKITQRRLDKIPTSLVQLLTNHHALEAR